MSDIPFQWILVAWLVVFAATGVAAFLSAAPSLRVVIVGIVTVGLGAVAVLYRRFSAGESG